MPKWDPVTIYAQWLNDEADLVILFIYFFSDSVFALGCSFPSLPLYHLLPFTILMHTVTSFVNPLSHFIPRRNLVEANPIFFSACGLFSPFMATACAPFLFSSFYGYSRSYFSNGTEMDFLVAAGGVERKKWQHLRVIHL